MEPLVGWVKKLSIIFASYQLKLHIRLNFQPKPRWL